MTFGKTPLGKMSPGKSLDLLILLAAIFALASCGGPVGSPSSGTGTGTTPPGTDSIAATSGAPQSAAVSTAFAAPLVATVTSGGSPASGVTVTFTAPSSGASGTFGSSAPAKTATATTDSNGVATSPTFTANATTGSYTVAATISGSSSPATFSLTNTVAPPTITIAPLTGTPQSAQTGMAFFAPLVATVLSNGSPLSGATVTFTAPASGASGTFSSNSTNTETQTTDANGNATSSTFTANSTAAGPYAVTAAVPGAASPANFNLTNSSAAPVTAISVGSGSPQSAQVGTAFGFPLMAAVTQNGSPLGGVSVTFAAPASGASGTFASNGTNAETQITDANGNATSSTFTANAAAGGPYAVAATVAGVSSSAAFQLTNLAATTGPLANGTYVFSLGGQHASGGYFTYVAGAFTVDGGVVTSGEQDFRDYYNPSTLTDVITGGSVTTTSDGNLQIALETGDAAIGVSGTETLNATVVSSTKALINEFDTSATASGELDLQTTTAPVCATPPCGYAFFVNGGDAITNPTSIAGVMAITGVSGGAGTISGAGSVFDYNDLGTVQQNQPFAASTVSAPDGFGRVQFSLILNNSDVGGIGLAGYVVDGNRIALVENSGDPNDIVHGVTGGAAFAQGANTGNFSAASIKGTSFVFAANGGDKNGFFQTAGVLTTNSDGSSVSGTLSANDLTGAGVQTPIAFTGSYAVAATGRVALSGLNDGFISTAQLYLTAGHQAILATADPAEQVAGYIYQQTGPFTSGSFAGNYALNATGFGFPVILSPVEFDAVGSITAGSGSLSGTVDLNLLAAIQNTSPKADVAISGNFTAGSSAISSGTITGLDVTTSSNQDSFTYYLIDATQGVVIETDPNQLTLGYFELQP
jgi:hypothetical protein